MADTAAAKRNPELHLPPKPSFGPITHYLSYLNPLHLVVLVYGLLYQLAQTIIIAVFKPPPPSRQGAEKPKFGRIAIIGAGLSGVSSAATAVAHNFDVVIFEENEAVGGIWAHVNSTSGLQLNSMLYRFHPAVHWSKAFPLRDEIVGEIRRIWKEYGLESKTRLNTKVTKVTRHEGLSTDPSKGGHARWIINDGADGVFDAVIATIGTCGEPSMISLENQDAYKGRVLHSSQLDSLSPNELKGKKIVVVGSGASGVESVELAVKKGAGDVTIVARDDKWIIPRNIVFDTMLSMQPFGREMPLSFIPEFFLKRFHYRDLTSVAPAHKGFYEGTPIVNDEFLQHIRDGKVTYTRGDTLEFTPSGLRINVRGEVWSKGYSSTTIKDSDSKATNGGTKYEAGQGGRFTHPKEDGDVRDVQADVVVLATGFKQPPVDFLPKDLFPERYERPNLYLQNFATEDWSVVLTNAAYKNAIGTVGHFHIGIYTRILLMFLLDESVRPPPQDLRLWVDLIRFIKRGAPGGALAFFTYMELTIWVVTFLFFRLGRLKWTLFVLFGWGVY